MLFGYSLIGWLIALIAAVVCAALVVWLLPLLGAAVGLAVPQIIVTLLAILVFLCVLFGGPRVYPAATRRT